MGVTGAPGDVGSGGDIGQKVSSPIHIRNIHHMKAYNMGSE